ncbi:N-acetylmuramoyl-L-alanine amidase [Paenibacillus flagellatus]|uniref:N-acetylmuramoyl-L-alanine amidase n=1 Tax=Paenibacillus flagellatus TaxID=2211139 RepID=UPI001B85E6CA|nr:N-acetylmuramoyl-L-alanine amidase [Paenibacillus flagellatus]
MRNGFRSLLLAASILMAAPVHAFAAKTVVVDAGHGGSDPGAVGVNGLYEKHVNFDIAMKLKQLLLGQGYDVVLTRTTDDFISLAERVERTNAAAPSLFVSVHANSHPNSGVGGSLVLYYDRQYPQEDYPPSDAMAALTPESKKLASLVLEHVLAEAGFADKGIVPSAAYVIRMGQVPSILVETAFLSNAGDASRLADESVRQKLANGIAAGIAAYLPLPAVFPDLADHWARDAVLRLKDKGIVEGIDNRYIPDRPMTRAEWLTVGDRLFGFSKLLEKVGTSPSKDVPNAASFPDLPKSHWAYATFRQALKLGFINGYEDGTVRPDQPVTRAEAAALLERMSEGANKTAWTGKTDFADVPASYWASGPIYRMKQKGILDGVTDKTFAPAKSMTRAEMAALIDRYVALPASARTAAPDAAADKAPTSSAASSSEASAESAPATGPSAASAPSTTSSAASPSAATPSPSATPAPSPSGETASQTESPAARGTPSTAATPAAP